MILFCYASLTCMFVLIFIFLSLIIYDESTFIVEKRLLKSQKKQEKYKEQLKRLSILNDSEAKNELVEEIEVKLIIEESNSEGFNYKLKQKKIGKQKKELYRILKKEEKEC